MGCRLNFIFRLNFKMLNPNLLRINPFHWKKEKESLNLD